MKIVLRCTCGNNAGIQAKARDNIVLKDNLEAYSFYVGREKCNRVSIQCKCCNREWITLELD